MSTSFSSQDSQISGINLINKFKFLFRRCLVNPLWLEVSELKTMKTNQEYIYSFDNTSFTLRVIEHLRNKYQMYLDSVVVINLIDRWLVQVCLKNSIPSQSTKNLLAFLNEMGFSSQPSSKIINALASLEQGESPTKVMNRYQVAIVVHGQPETEEIEIFRDQIVDRLGYCPQNMA